MALLLEHTGNNVKALEKWEQLKTEDGCRKTVQILRKSQITSTDTIFKFIKWVLEMKPEIGLSLFTSRHQSTGKSSKQEKSAGGSKSGHQSSV
mmetsp:Transcript_16010/g.24831  ORF Transcript_16010/g.24831 Transcript_16010/m.24831 type:complete len:93 (-) Transcript_16010:1081-1359(-)